MSTGSGTGTPIVASASQDYCTLAQLKANLTINDTNDNVALSALITAASRAIDKETRRFFYTKPSTGTEIRYFTAEDTYLVHIDDCISISALATDEAHDRTYATIWSASDYELEPYNAALAIEPEPYNAIRRTPNGNYYFPAGDYPYLSVSQQLPSSHVDNYYGRKAIKITGTWGWSAVPSQIAQACLLQAHRWFKRRDAIFGVMGSADMGQLIVIPKLDPDFALMVRNYRKVRTG